MKQFLKYWAVCFAGWCLCLIYISVTNGLVEPPTITYTQQWMQDHGYPTTVDGVAGDETITNWKQFSLEWNEDSIKEYERLSE